MCVGGGFQKAREAVAFSTASFCLFWCLESSVWQPIPVKKNTALKRYLAACCWPCCSNLGGGFRESPFLPQIRVSSGRDPALSQQGAIVLDKMGVLR